MSDMVYGDASIYYIPPSHEGTGQKTIKCYVCQKERPVYSMQLWHYRIGAKFFCSYGCQRAYEKAHPKPPLKECRSAKPGYYACNLKDLLHDEAIAFLDQQPPGTEWTAREFWEAFSGSTYLLQKSEDKSIHYFLRGVVDWLPVRVKRYGQADVKAYRKMKGMD